ncbi:MAG TPA: response regulator transcription factor [Segetibacter sp.]
MSLIRIVIVEDETEIRESLYALICTSEDIDVVKLFGDGESAVEYLKKKPVDVALFDINLPGISGIEAIAQLKDDHPRIQFMVLSAYDEPDYIFRALRAGASGYILKNADTNKLIEAIKDVFNGGSPMSSQIARKVVNEFATSKPLTTYSEELSRRENEILEQLSKGYRYKEIADQLFISTETVRTHIRNIYEKLQVNSRDEALKKARST